MLKILEMAITIKTIRVLGICGTCLLCLSVLVSISGFRSKSMILITALAYVGNSIIWSIYLKHISGYNLWSILKVMHGLCTGMFLTCIIVPFTYFEFKIHDHFIYVGEYAKWILGGLSIGSDLLCLALMYRKLNHKMLIYCHIIPRLSLYLLVILSQFTGPLELQKIATICLLAGEFIFFWKLKGLEIKPAPKSGYDVDLTD